MSITKTLTRSFAGGEIAPELMGRLDLDKFQTALKQCRNWIPLAHGPIRTRPGTRFVNYAKDQSNAVRLVPFQWSIDQTMVLEVGHNYIQFHHDGQTLLNTSQSITSITCGTSTAVTKVAHGYADGDIVYFTGVTGTAASRINSRFFEVDYLTADTFNLLQRNGVTLNTSGMTAVVTSAAMASCHKVSTAYASDDVFSLRYVQNSDVLTLTHTSYPPREVRRMGAANWQISNITFEPSLAAPSSAYASSPYVDMTVPGGYTMFNGYKVTAVTDDDEESEASNNAVHPASFTITGITDANPTVLTIGGTHSNLIVGGSIKIVGLANTGQDAIAYAALEGKVLDISAVGATTVTVNADLTALTGNLVPSGTPKLWMVTFANTLTAAGAKNQINWSAVTAASYYKVYKATTGQGVYGYMGRTTGTSFADNNITADTTKTAPEGEGAFDAVGDYPKCCTYFEQRRVFASTENDPQTVWMTQTGTETNLLSSVPHQDNDAIRFRMAARDHNSIEHIVPMNDLILLTSAGEWRAYAPNGDPITAESLVIRPQSFAGCSSATPALTEGSMIFSQYGGWSLRELSYSWESQTYKSTDITAMAPHLFESNTIVDMAFQRVPVPVLWVVMSDGSLVSCTYMPEHKVVAFATHDTSGGYFESVCTLVESGEDAVYFVVRRTDSTGATIRCIERLSTMRQLDDLADSFQVDCGLSYSGAATDTLTGLWHLEGKTVSVMTDGAVHPQVVVTNGAITLEYAASKVSVGLPISAQAETMPLAFELPDGGVSNVKNVNRAWIKVKRTNGLHVGPTPADLIDTTVRTDEHYGEAPEATTGIIEVPILPYWSAEGTLILRQDDPLPAMVMSISYEVAIDA